MNGTRKTLAAAFGLALLAVPAAALADPPAASPPTPPSVFNGAPTTQGAQGGEFTLNFDSLGRFEGTGRPANHPGSFELTPEQQRRQARSRSSASSSAAVDRLFVSFLRQLRTVDVRQGSR